MLTPLVLVVTGVVAGSVNTVAGGGSLLTLPVLMACGLGANAANGTNRIGILVQSVIAAVVFGRSGKIDWKGALQLMAPVVIGAVIGAQLSVEVPEHILRAIIGVVMVLVLVSLWVRPKRWLTDADGAVRMPPWWGWLGLLGVGLYAGFLQAGAGILFLMLLVWGTGRDLVSANGMKVLLVALLTVPALVLFGAQDLIHWQEGLWLAVGQSVGGLLGAKLTVRWGPSFVRVFLLVSVATSVPLILFW